MEPFWIIRFLYGEEAPICAKINGIERDAIQVAIDYSVVKHHEAIFVIAPDRDYQVIHKI